MYHLSRRILYAKVRSKRLPVALSAGCGWKRQYCKHSTPQSGRPQHYFRLLAPRPARTGAAGAGGDAGFSSSELELDSSPSLLVSPEELACSTTNRRQVWLLVELHGAHKLPPPSQVHA
jgi:hypothetical protein